MKKTSSKDRHNYFDLVVYYQKFKSFIRPKIHTDKIIELCCIFLESSRRALSEYITFIRKGFDGPIRYG